MSTAVWPPIAPDDQKREEEASLARELEWLLRELQDSLQALKDGLEECATLLAPNETGSTLVLTTVRSESLKGFITRVGTRIVKGDIKLRLPNLPPPRGLPSYDFSISAAPQAPPFMIDQLTSVRALINSCLDIVDVTKWGGDPKNAQFIAGQLRLLYDNIEEARQTLKGYSDTQRPWWENPMDERIFEPPLPPNVSVHLYLFEAALLVEVRTLEPFNPAEESHSGFSIRDRLAVALGASRAPAHDEVNQTFKYKGQTVRVKDKVRVETQDPNLISAMAKLNALEHSVGLSRKALDIVMGKED